MNQPHELTFFNKVTKKLRRLYQYQFDMSFDTQTGLYKYPLYGSDVFVKYKHDLLERKEHIWKCSEIYFKGYTPKTDDVIFDLGAGYGEEAVYLADRSAGLKYLGLEILPSVYECLSNTISHLDGDYRASPYALTDSDLLYLSSQYKYSSVSDTHKQGPIEAFGKRWQEILALYDIAHIDMFKMNIEGAEISVLESISDFSIIDRFAIECHDFRANMGHGEHFRTKERIIEILTREGYRVSQTHFGIPGYEWADNWVHAAKSDL